jgi:integrase
MESSIKVIRTYCPFWRRTLYELWDGFLPVIPANNYLHTQISLCGRTLARKAYSLIVFFRFLKRNGLSYFELDARLVETYIPLFRNELLLRARARQFEDSDLRVDLAENNVKPIGYQYAKDILAEVGWLCVWWGIISVRKYMSSRERIRSPRDSRFLPDNFQIRIPNIARPGGVNHALEPGEVSKVWDYVTRESRPARPLLLTKYPLRPPKAWSKSKVRVWDETFRHYRVQLAWFHRQQMLWALLISSAMRRSEVPLIMLADILLLGEELWVSLRVRLSTKRLGRAKTGPRTIFIGWDDRVRISWEKWSRSRQVLVDRWMAKTGMEDHGMFLTNHDGGPLTVAGMDSLFAMLNEHFGVFGGEFPEEQFQIHPHAIRHTVESLFRQWGVPLDVRQRHLGHKNPETTNLYGKSYRSTYTGTLTNLLAVIQKAEVVQ